MPKNKNEPTTPAPGDATTTANVGAGVDLPPANVDRVSMASVRKDGEPDQTDPFEFIDGDTGEAILAEQQESVADPNIDAVRRRTAR